jgi:hypothetical protein
MIDIFKKIEQFIENNVNQSRFKSISFLLNLFYELMK